MTSREIPDSAKSPFSMQADYASPKLYGYASLIIGIFSIVFGAVAFAFMNQLSILLICAIGVILAIVGFSVIRKGK